MFLVKILCKDSVFPAYTFTQDVFLRILGFPHPDRLQQAS